MGSPRRRERGFLRLGDLSPAQVGLPRKHAEELRLEVLWRRIAGELLARKVRPARRRGGILELTVEDEGWARVLSSDLLRDLAGRLAGEAPEWKVRKFVIRMPRDAARTRSPALPVPVAAGASGLETNRGPGAGGAPPEPPAPPSLEARLRSAREEYLRNLEGRRGEPPRSER
jgi:hypothetical protein